MEDAEDLTQGFFARMLERNFLAKADPERGKLRNFLLVCLKRYLADEHRKASCQKRGGRAIHVPLADAGERVAEEFPPDALFHREWARVILERGVSRLREAWREKRKAGLFEALVPFLESQNAEDAAARSGVAERLGMTRNALSVAVHRIRRDFRRALLEEIALTIASDNPDDIEAEIKELMALF